MADSKLRNAFYMAYLLTLILREPCSKHEPLYVIVVWYGSKIYSIVG